MSPHLSITCPQVNSSLIILQGIQINLVGKIDYIAACTNWHLKWWPRDRADRQWPQPAAAFIHLLAALSASYYAPGHQGQVHTPTGSGAEPPPQSPHQRTALNQATLHSLGCFQAHFRCQHGPGTQQAVRTCPFWFGRSEVFTQCQLAAGPE